MAAEFEVYQDDVGEYRWRLRVNGGDIIAVSSQGYWSKPACVRSIDDLREIVVSASINDALT